MQNYFYTKTNRLVIEGFIVGVGFFLAYQIRYDGQVPAFDRFQFWLLLLPIVVGRLITNVLFGLQKHQWRYVSTLEAVYIARAYVAFSSLLLVLRLGLPVTESFKLFRIPRGIVAIEFLISLLGALSIRLLRRILYQRELSGAPIGEVQRLLLVGAGTHGATVAREMVLHKGIKIVGFVDDDPQKTGAVIAGVKVLGPITALPEIAKAHQVDQVLVCIPPAARTTLDLNGSKNLAFQTRVVPTLDEILQSEPNVGLTETTAGRNHRDIALRAAALTRYTTTVRNKTILITGGAGFIGSSLAEKLAPANRVVLLDTTFRGRPIEFSSLLKHRNVVLVEGNLVRETDLPSLCREADIVIHAAAIVGVNRVCSSGRETLETNYVGTSRLLQALEGSRRLERLVYFSTSEVFGVNSFRVDESSPPSVGPIAEARWSYAIAKLASEHLVTSYYRETRMPVAIVRPFNVFGPRRTGEHAILKFVLNAIAGHPLEVHGDGSQIRSWCYIEDFCVALLAMLERPEAVGEDFNIGNPGNTLTICELARKVLDLTGTAAPIVFTEHPCPDISVRVPSLAKAQRLLGYRPRFDLDSALVLTIEWYRKHWDFFATRFEVSKQRAYHA